MISNPCLDKRLYLVLCILLHDCFAQKDKKVEEHKIEERKKVAMDIRRGPGIDEIAGRIRLKERATAFNNIPAEIKNVSTGNETYTTICPRGVILMYELPHFAVKNPDSLEGISVHSSQDVVCYPIADVGELGSARAATNLVFEGAHLTLFTAKNFLGAERSISTEEARHRLKVSVEMTVGSLIISGSHHWQLALDNGVIMCIAPKDSKSGFCMLSNFEDKKLIPPSSIIRHVLSNCRKNRTGIIDVKPTECYDIGPGSSPGLIKPLNPSWPFEPPTNESEGNETAEETDCRVDETEDILTSEQKYLIEGRLNGTINTGDWMQTLEDPRNIWRTELFDICLRIFMSICDARVIEPEYLILYASLFFHHLDKAWMAGTEFSYVDFKEADWMEIMHDINECHAEVLGGDHGPNIPTIVTLLQNYESLDTITEKIDHVLGLRPDFDYVLEIHWMMANTVASVCHDVFRGSINFLTRFWNAYHPLYFTPIIEPWEKPGNITVAYKYIFGGYGMKKSFARIGLCAASAMLASNAIEPYPRPMEQSKTILLPKYNQFDVDSSEEIKYKPQAQPQKAENEITEQ